MKPELGVVKTMRTLSIVPAAAAAALAAVFAFGIPLSAQCVYQPGTGAPPLRVDEIPVSAARAEIDLGPLVPGANGNGPFQLLYSFPKAEAGAALQPFEIIAVDLATGKYTRAPAGMRSQPDR